ncbi:response regulator transcription factor [Roseomonas sp. HJA6]|uniref:Response regulator transcription factor n=1 Tax=Roseomonas alba TaxID=2846776 RepID=A0ABS7ACM1_9PROT|nr:response regulator transcription factor [Neoroseomonas alba]MBW6400038.1 response regulator transcription factor [Neoroseomonas alba]
MSRGASIAMVDDEPDLLDAYAEYLGDLGYDVALAGSAAEFEALLARRQVDLVVLDIMMPGEDGLSLLRRLRSDLSMPVLVMTAVTDSVERVLGLELGADDLIAKPAEPQELAARIAGLLRRAGARPRELVALEHGTVDLTAARLLRLGQAPEPLRPGELMLLRAFAANPNRILGREELIALAPADSREAGDRAIDMRIARLRAKLRTEAIVTLRGRGYMFVPPGPKPGGPD